jgi:histone-lysine N-methyltransferase SETMAR
MLNRIVTGDESWVHHYQPESKCASVQWKHPSSPSPEILRLHHQLGRLFLPCFVARFQKQGENVNSVSYCEVLLKLQNVIHRKHPSQLARGVLLHHDNDRHHTARETQERIQELWWELPEHLPYSLDLALSDFHLFGQLKNHLGGKCFIEDEEDETEAQKWLRQHSKDFYSAAFYTLVKRWDKCINAGGGYVKKCFFHIRISHILLFISICDLFTNFPSYHSDCEL